MARPSLHGLAQSARSPGHLMVLAWIVIFTGGSILLGTAMETLLVEHCGSGSACYVLGEDRRSEVEGGSVFATIATALGWSVLICWLISLLISLRRGDNKIVPHQLFAIALGVLAVPMLLSPVLLMIAEWLGSDGALQAGLGTSNITVLAMLGLIVWLIAFLASRVWRTRS